MEARGLVMVGAIAATIAIPSCSVDAPSSAGSTSWVGSISTEGNVTTVVNESGSVWGGAATLVEEMSIGVDAGADEYMLGVITGMHASDDKIILADRQAGFVRMYDHDGNFLGNLGGPGEGPGEYDSPSLITTNAAGTIFVLDTRLRRINVYSPSGEPIDTWPLSISRCCNWPMFPLHEDAIWAPVRELRDRNYWPGAQAVGPDGPFGEVAWVPDVEFDEATFAVNGREMAAPFSAALAWNAMPEGGLVYGASDDYRFEVLRSDGSRMVVERFWEPVSIPPEHREWERQMRVAFERQSNDPELSWDGANMPDHQPAYYYLMPGHGGELWVFRQTQSRRLPGCIDNPIVAGYREASRQRCWETDLVIDAFAPDGRYLGEVDEPDDLLPGMSLSIAGDRVVGVSQDDAGIYRVKRYRLTPPAEGDA